MVVRSRILHLYTMFETVMQASLKGQPGVNFPAVALLGLIIFFLGGGQQRGAKL